MGRRKHIPTPDDAAHRSAGPAAPQRAPADTVTGRARMVRGRLIALIAQPPLGDPHCSEITIGASPAYSADSLASPDAAVEYAGTLALWQALLASRISTIH